MTWSMICVSAHVDLLELAISGSNLHVGLASPGEEATARHDALHTLAEAEALFGPSAVLYHERTLLAEKLGERAVAQAARRGTRRAAAHRLGALRSGPVAFE